jgi:hypothetical protein
MSTPLNAPPNQSISPGADFPVLFGRNELEPPATAFGRLAIEAAAARHGHRHRRLDTPQRRPNLGETFTPAVRSCIGSVRLVDLQHARWPGRLRFSFPSLGGADLANSTHLISQFEKILCALSVSQETPIILFARRNWPPPLQPGRGHFAVPNTPSNTPAPALPRRGAVRSESRALPWPVPLPERWGRP